MTQLATSAAIGIGVPLGVILIASIAGIIYAATSKRKKAARGDVELVKTEPEAAPPPAQKVIRWNPNGTISKRLWLFIVLIYWQDKIRAVRLHRRPLKGF